MCNAVEDDAQIDHRRRNCHGLENKEPDQLIQAHLDASPKWMSRLSQSLQIDETIPIPKPMGRSIVMMTEVTNLVSEAKSEDRARLCGKLRRDGGTRNGS
jgi:hypothetical protein